MIGDRLDSFRARLGLLGHLDVALGAILMIFWAATAGLSTGSWPGVGLLAVFSVGLHLAAVDSGRHLLAWAATGWILALIGVAGVRTIGDLSPVAYTVAGSSALGYNELVRLSYARRRRATVDAAIYVQAALAIAIVATVAVITIALAQPVAAGGDRTWLWMPAAVGSILIVVAALLVVPTVRAPEAERSRWNPGERLPPQPASDDA